METSRPANHPKAKESHFWGKRPLGVAHRGASRDAPENTLAAFRLALDLGARALECDARRSRDGYLVVMHDQAVDRTTDGRGTVESLTLDEIRRFDAGRWFGAQFAGERIPLLEEVLQLARGRAVVKLEIKNDPTPSAGIEQQIVDLVHRLGMAGEVLVMSFDHECIRTVHALAPHLATGIIYTARLADAPGAARAAGADALCPNWCYVSRRDVDGAHTAGLRISVWTVDDENALRGCLALGVDAVTSNDTRLLLRVLGAQ